MRLLLLPFLLWSFAFSLTQEEIDLLNTVRKNTSDVELIEKIEQLLNHDKKHNNTSTTPVSTTRMSTYIKVTCVIVSLTVTLIVAVELLRILLGNELLLSKTKALYGRSKKLLTRTKELRSDTQELRKSNEALKDMVDNGVLATGELLEEVQELSRKTDTEEKLARSDVELFKRVNELEKRLKALNGDAFISISEALNLSPTTMSPKQDSPVRDRRNSVFSFADRFKHRNS